MRYCFSITEEGLCVGCNREPLLENIRLRISYSQGYGSPVSYLPDTISEGERETIVFFRRMTEKAWMPEAKPVVLLFRQNGNALSCSLCLETNKEAEAFSYTICPQNSVYLDFTVPDFDGNILTLHRERNPYFMTQKFCRKQEELCQFTQSVSAQIGNIHLHLMPNSTTAAMCHMEKSGLVLSTCSGRISKLETTCLLLSAGAQPYEAIHSNFVDHCAAGILIAKPMEERPYPQQFEGLGWCSWNAFYQDVTEDKLIAKLEEFKRKGIRIHWLLIDDGWSQYTEDRKLLSFRVDPVKFPHGLKYFTDIAKREYGVKYVGVWHAFTGYWSGISKDGELYREYRHLLYTPDDFWVLPGETKEKALSFWKTWHGYLASQGIDFVKVDNQSAFLSKFDYVLPPVQGVRTQLDALQESVDTYFGGAVINCMGTELTLNVNRHHCCINRNSGDYYPHSELHTLAKHIIQNAYVAAVHNELHCCDYDMFWSEHPQAVSNGVLRALSGGPVYISDEVGHTDAFQLKSVADAQGCTMRFPTALKPTLDCFYQDCAGEEVPLKLFNQANGNFVLAAFGVTNGKRVFGKFSLRDIPGAAGEYLVHDFFGKKYFRMDGDSVIPLDVDCDECRLYTFYPIQNGNARIGNPGFYAQAAQGVLREVSVSDILK